jgi:glycosyltransferase involved in cell wall biosynthesis
MGGDYVMRKKVLVRGPALTSSGYGEHARLILRALRAHEEHFEIFFENINWGQTGFIIDDSDERVWMEHLLGKTQQYKQSQGTFDVAVQVTIPNEWEKIAPTNIGVTAGIETTKIAPHWIEKSKLMDKIIVPSNHAKFGFDNTVYQLANQQTGEQIDFRNETPVEVIHYPVKDVQAKSVDLNLKYDFNFLTVAQWGPRKNLDNTIRWFLEEFRDEEVGLVIKANIKKNNIVDRNVCKIRIENILKDFKNRKCAIHLIHGNMSEEEMVGVYTHSEIKAIVSTTHGEGFGLPLFEAAYNELPVVAPNWSGHVDFLYAPKKDKKGKIKDKPYFTKVDYNIAPVQKEAVWDGVVQADSQWCFPKQVSFKGALRSVYKSYGPKKSEAKKLSKHIRETFTKEKAYGKVLQLIMPEEDRAMMQEIESMFEELSV